jgi:uncharacterized protein YceK
MRFSSLVILPLILSGCASVAPAPFERTAYPSQSTPVVQDVVRSSIMATASIQLDERINPAIFRSDT